MIMKNMRLHDDAIAFLRNVRLMDGKIEDRDMGAIPLPKDAPQRAEILIKPMAYAKMIALIQSFSTEIGWHGICKRSAEKDNVFTIEDVFVYPQIVTGTNISTDEAAQDAWNRSFSDEDFKNLRFHGHSHVNMSVFSSGTDDDLQRDIINMLTGDKFYLFFIMNKRMDLFVRLYDAKYSVMYETKDCDVRLDGEGCDLNAFLEDAKGKVKERYTPSVIRSSAGTYANPPAGSYPSYSSNQKPVGKENGRETWKKDDKAGKGKGEKQGKGKYGGKDYGRRGHTASDWESYPYGWYDDLGNWHELRGSC